VEPTTAVQPVPNTSNGESTTPNQTPTSTPKKANNSLILFFRKVSVFHIFLIYYILSYQFCEWYVCKYGGVQFYSLAVVRMNDLCTRLRLTSDELKRKIWTCLEHALAHQTSLMRDRHLDQILMCTVYVVCKVPYIGSIMNFISLYKNK
jgi:hypothetical protein